MRGLACTARALCCCKRYGRACVGDSGMCWGVGGFACRDSLCLGSVVRDQLKRRLVKVHGPVAGS
eukprot:11987114-Alexandrium_andersonii.AAC.1